MSFENKYRVHEVAKDFGKQTKDITQILTTYATAPKNHMQVLSDKELSIVFEYMTQHNQVADMQASLATAPKGGENRGRNDRNDRGGDRNRNDRGDRNGQQGQRRDNRDGGRNDRNDRNDRNGRPGDRGPRNDRNDRGQQNRQGGQNQHNNQAPKSGSQNNQQAQQPANRPTSRVPEKKLVDTRKGGNVNLDKYDEHLEALAPERANRMQSGKQKIQSRNNHRKGATFGNKRRQEEQEKMRKLQLEIAKKTPLTVKIPDEIGVGELASRMKKTGAEVVKQLMKLGVMASLSEIIDYDTAALVAMELGCKVEKEVIVTIEEKLIDTAEDKEEDLRFPAPPSSSSWATWTTARPPCWTISGTPRSPRARPAASPRHIGAYQVDVNGSPITFLDTPGHEAFTAMRARGAMITDIAILVVAADDGIMPQTVESINHAKAAEIPIIVAINKMDKPEANPERVKQQLTEYGLVSEEWGGDTICCPISAKTGMGVDNLLEMVVLTAEMRELKANPNRSAHGAVIEARLDKGRGPVATLLVQNGTLHQGDVIIAGTAVGRVRAMTDAKGRKINEAGPSVPVEITGMGEVPGAGDDFHAVADERMARELVEQRKHENKMAANSSSQKVTLDDLFSQIQQGELKDLNIIVKADVQGSAEAVKASLEKLTNEEVRVRVIHCAVGAINESDVMLASTSNAIIVGFNVRPDANAKDTAARSKVDMRMYRVIYDCINEMEAAMKGMLAPKFKEVSLGAAEVREVYKITGAGIIAGCYITEGKVQRNAQIRLVRDGIVVHEGTISSLQRFKDAVKEVAQGYECGIGIEKYSDIKVGDVIEAFIMEQIEV